MGIGNPLLKRSRPDKNGGGKERARGGAGKKEPRPEKTRRFSSIRGEKGKNAFSHVFTEKGGKQSGSGKKSRLAAEKKPSGYSSAV